MQCKTLNSLILIPWWLKIVLRGERCPLKVLDHVVLSPSVPLCKARRYALSAIVISFGETKDKMSVPELPPLDIVPIGSVLEISISFLHTAFAVIRHGEVILLASTWLTFLLYNVSCFLSKFGNSTFFIPPILCILKTFNYIPASFINSILEHDIRQSRSTGRP